MNFYDIAELTGGENDIVRAWFDDFKEDGSCEYLEEYLSETLWDYAFSSISEILPDGDVYPLVWFTEIRGDVYYRTFDFDSSQVDFPAMIERVLAYQGNEYDYESQKPGDFIFCKALSAYHTRRYFLTPNFSTDFDLTD